MIGHGYHCLTNKERRKYMHSPVHMEKHLSFNFSFRLTNKLIELLKKSYFLDVFDTTAALQSSSTMSNGM